MDTIGKYHIPIINPVDIDECPEFIGFNYAISEKHPEEKGIHFYLDDYLFERIWNNPHKYLPILRRFKVVMSPDFSMYTDYPPPLQIYNCWRRHVLAAWWQKNGITVIPTISWIGEDSYDWCFEGDPVGGCVTVSAISTQSNQAVKQMFLDGYNEMLRRLSPSKIIFYGTVPEGCEGNIIRIKSYVEKWRKE